MRVEKPGVGDSEGGPFATLDYTTELDIYRQALKQLKSLDYVDTDNVFIFGHSMGGAFGPMIACEIPVKGLAMYGIAARTWHEYLLDTLRYQTLLSGGSYSDIDDLVRKSSRVFELVFQDNLTPDQVKKAHPDLAATVDANFVGGLFNAKASSFWSQLENTNFASYWAKCNAHVLAVHGASDFVSYEVDHRLVADIVNKVHPGWGKFVTAPSSDHLFSNWPTEAESLSHWPRGDFNPAFIGILKSWITDVMQGK
jgi:pimeloyl-ACP methyl ester carboxylesterase